MRFSPGNIYHIYNQGNNRQKIFNTENDYLIFLTLYKRLFENTVSTIAWCLMPNHFHFMIHTDERCLIKIKQGGITIDIITNNLRKLLSGYARIYNSKNGRTGSLFRQKTKSTLLSDINAMTDTKNQNFNSYTNCFRYIHQNPLRAKLVANLKDWKFSSFCDYAGLRNGLLCKKELAALYCGFNPLDFIEKSHELVEEGIISHLKN